MNIKIKLLILLSAFVGLGAQAQQVSIDLPDPSSAFAKADEEKITTFTVHSDTEAEISYNLEQCYPPGGINLYTTNEITLTGQGLSTPVLRTTGYYRDYVDENGNAHSTNQEPDEDEGYTFSGTPNQVGRLLYSGTVKVKLYRGITYTLKARRFQSCTNCRINYAEIYAGVTLPQSCFDGSGQPIYNTPPSVTSPVFTCEGKKFAAVATHGQLAEFKWYRQSDGGTAFAFGPNFEYEALSNPITFYVSAVSSLGCETPRASVIFTPYVSASISGSATGCAPVTGMATVTTSYGVDHWEISSTGGASWDPVSNATTSKSYNYTVEESSLIRAVLKTGICLTPSQHATITVNKSIGGAPIANYSLTSCGRLAGTISLGNSAKGNIKEWNISDDAINWTPITLADLSAPVPFDHTENKYYQAKVQFENCAPAFSSVLAIKPKPHAGKVNISSIISCESATGSVTLDEKYGNVVYWQTSETPEVESSWVAKANSANSIFNFTNISESTGFRAVVSLDDCPTTLAYSQVASITINKHPQGILSKSESTNRSENNCKDENGKIVLVGEFKLKDYTGTILTWERLDNSSPTWVTLDNTSGKDSYQYNVSISTKFRVRLGKDGCNNIFSGEATIHVNQEFKGVKSAPQRFVNEYDGYSFKTTGTGSVILGKGFKFYANSCQDFEISIDPNYVVAYPNMNFVLSEAITKEGITKPEDVDWLDAFDKTSAFEYYDDLGRPIQKVIRKGSPTQKDLITPIVYDRTTKEEKQLLPYVASSNDGSFKEDFARKQAEFYMADDDRIANSLFPYSRKIFDESPLSRVREQGSVGELYQPSSDGSGKTVKIAYLLNTETDIKVWEVVDGLPVSSGNYAALELKTVITTDPNGYTTKHYNDWQGKLVYEKKESKNATNQTVWLQTYYVYDDFGNLNFVFPPEAVNQLSGNLTDEFLQQWVYCYEFDEKQRTIGKRVPGSDWVYSFYDKSDRLILSQDGNQRENREYTFAKYDYLGRAVMSGTWKDLANLSRSDIQTNVESTSAYSEERVESNHGYTLDKIYPSASSGDVLTVTYYDDYDFISKNYFAGASNAYNYATELGNSASNQLIRGKSTGSKTKVLSGSSYLKSVTYYDNNYQSIQSISESHIAGLDRITRKYDFGGQVTETLYTHTAKEKTTTILDRFDFDHAGRVITHHHKINNAPSVVLTQYEYNELGQMVDKNIQPTTTAFLQSVDYRYNIDGALTHINNKELAFDGAATNDDNSDLFGLELNYDTNLQIDPSKAQFNGNIAEVLWKNDHDKKLMGYSFSYDPLSRLKGAAYKVKEGNWTSSLANGNYNEEIPDYDYNGNIKTLNRKGLTGYTNTNSPIFSNMDQLHYHYRGNQLLAVVDDHADYTLPVIGRYDDFSDGSTENIAYDPANPITFDYTYDENGNLTSDKNKGITSITYNLLDLPEQITFADGKSILYTYDATGSKLKEEVLGLSTTNSSDYVGLFQYKNDEIQQIFTSVGRIIPASAGTYRYEYSLSDHLGNIRLWFDEDPLTMGKARILQCQDYYPTGLKLSNSFNSKEQNNYLYNGKEWQGDLGLNWYAYGARMLDPTIVRWNGIDAKAESYYHCSPYAYADNNPINNTDPDGNATVYGAYGMQYAAGRANNYYQSGMQHAAYTQAYHSRGLMTPFEQNQMYYGSYWNNQLNVWRRLAGGPSLTGGSYSVSGVSFDGFATLSGKVFSPILKATPFIGPVMGAIQAARRGDVGDFALNMGFGATDLGVLIASSKVSYKTFYTVQSPEDASRLRGGGTPWPNTPSRSALGEGVYAWDNLASARAYQDRLSSAYGAKTEIMRFKVALEDLNSFKGLNIDALSDEQAEAWLGQNSKLWNANPSNSYDYIMRGTNYGVEHYFNSNIFQSLNITIPTFTFPK